MVLLSRSTLMSQSQATSRLPDQVAEKIRQLIIDQQLMPGAKLPAERALAEQLNVSRPPLREALRMLASEGLLLTRRGDGTYVQASIPDWTSKSLSPLKRLASDDPAYNYDMLEARQALESSTAWYAAIRATSEDKAKIQRCFDIMVKHQQQNDAELSSRADAQFHLAIAEASHNVVLIQFMQGLFDVLFSLVDQSRTALFDVDKPANLDQLTLQHENLMKAILEGNPEQARQQIDLHLKYVYDNVREFHENEARRQRANRITTSA